MKSKKSILFFTIVSMIIPIFLLFNSPTNIIIYTSDMLNLHFSASPLYVVISSLISLIFVVWILYYGNKSSIYGIIFAIIHMISSIFIVISNDFLSLLISWEIATLGALIILKTSVKNIKTSMLYTTTHILSGLLMIIGIIMLYNNTGSYELPAFTSMKNNADINHAHLLIIMSILINCASFPFSDWFIKSYSESSSRKNIILSAFTSKTALITLIKIYMGYDMLFYAGILTIAYSIAYSIFCKNLHKISFCGILCQIGMIITLCSIEKNQLLEKSLYFYIVACMLYQLVIIHSLNQIKSGYHNSALMSNQKYNTSLLQITLLITGVLSLSGLPISLGFISKYAIKLSVSEKIVPRLHHIYELIPTIVSILSISFISTRILMPFINKKIKHKWNDVIKQIKQEKNKEINIFLIMICLIPAIFYNTTYSIFNIYTSRILESPYKINNISFYIALGIVTFAISAFLQKTVKINLQFRSARKTSSTQKSPLNIKIYPLKNLFSCTDSTIRYIIRAIRVSMLYRLGGEQTLLLLIILLIYLGGICLIH